MLEEELARPGYVCKPITLGANTDPYQPVERRMGVTRSILEVLSRTRHPVTVITKSALVLRDLDLLAELARARLASVAVSVTTLDDELKRRMEPRAAAPQARLRVLRRTARRWSAGRSAGGAGDSRAHRPRDGGHPHRIGGGRSPLGGLCASAPAVRD